MTAAGSAPRAALLALAVVAVDQATKALVRAALDPFEERTLLPGVRVIDTRNTGIAFSLLAGNAIVVAVVTVVALGALVAFFVTQGDRPYVWVPVGMLVGGAAGNLLDRLRDGAVTDFVKLPHWPAFNLADVSITLGVLALVWVLERRA